MGGKEEKRKKRVPYGTGKGDRVHFENVLCPLVCSFPVFLP
jgi:hypothetical protein